MVYGKSLELIRLPEITKTLITEINLKKGHRAKSMPPSQRKEKREQAAIAYRGSKKYMKHLSGLDNCMIMTKKPNRRFVHREK